MKSFNQFHTELHEDVEDIDEEDKMSDEFRLIWIRELKKILKQTTDPKQKKQYQKEIKKYTDDVEKSRKRGGPGGKGAIRREPEETMGSQLRRLRDGPVRPADRKAYRVFRDRELAKIKRK